MKTHKELGISKWQYKNIAKLTLWMRDNEGKIKFDIKSFCRINFSNGGYETFMCNEPVVDALKEANKPNVCGTSACFLGYGPSAGVKGKKDEEWKAYALRVFGIEMGGMCNHPDDNYIWLFDDSHKNNHKAAVLRGAWLLENGPPEGYLAEEVPYNYQPNWPAIEAILN